MRARVALVALALVLGACGSDDAAEPGPTGDPDGTTAQAATCPPAAPPATTPRAFAGPPPDCLEAGVDYGAVVTTSEGTFTVDLAEDDHPVTVNNFVFLARWGWFDGDDFHRVVPGFVIQAGDPFGRPQGTGGPGYTIPDELPDAVSAYSPGTVAMANAGPDTGGSQWFVCVDCSGLPGPDYAIVGAVTEGSATVGRIAALGVADGPPSEPVTIRSVEITEG